MDFAALFDLSLAIAAGGGLAGAIIRGFTGFGTNLVWAPVLVLVYGPVETVAIMSISSLIASFPLCLPVLNLVNWRTMAPVAIAILIGAPIGAIALMTFEPEHVRRAIGAFVFAISVIMFTGWRYRGTHGAAAGAVAGALGGGIAGFAGVGGPLPVLYFMSSPDPAKVIRANNAIAVSVLGPPTLATLAIGGAVTWETVARGIILAVPYIGGQFIGSRLFNLSSDQLFKRVVLILLMVIGLAVMLR